MHENRTTILKPERSLYSNRQRLRRKK